MLSSGMRRCLALVRVHVSVEGIASIIRVELIIELGAKLSVTSNCRTLQKLLVSVSSHCASVTNYWYLCS
jgi:hypothetical protein